MNAQRTALLLALAALTQAASIQRFLETEAGDKPKDEGSDEDSGPNVIGLAVGIPVGVICCCLLTILAIVLGSLCCCKKSAEHVKQTVETQLKNKDIEKKEAAHTKQMNADLEKNQMN